MVGPAFSNFWNWDIVPVSTYLSDFGELAKKPTYRPVVMLGAIESFRYPFAAD